MAYVCILPSKQGVKIATPVIEKNDYVWLKTNPFWSLIYKVKINCMTILLLVFWEMKQYPFFQFLTPSVRAKSPIRMCSQMGRISR